MSRIKKARVIPFGYKIDPNDEKLLIEIPEQLAALEQAFKYLEEGYTWRATLDWLVKATSRQLSIAGFVLLKKQRHVGQPSTTGEEKEHESSGEATTQAG